MNKPQANGEGVANDGMSHDPHIFSYIQLNGGHLGRNPKVAVQIFDSMVERATPRRESSFAR